MTTSEWVAASTPLDEFVRCRYEEEFERLARMALGFGALAVLSLVPLDRAVVPEHFGRFALYRFAVALSLLLLLLVITKRPGTHRTRVGFAFFAGTAVAVMVAAMIRDFGGHQSAYFAGFILILVFVSAFLPLPAPQGIGITVVVYAIYLLPILAYDAIRDLPFFLTANVLMLACAASLLLLQQIHYRRLLAGYALRFEIEQHRSLLESRVEERTTELREKVGELERATAEVRALNAGLEERVRERTGQLIAANRELESFSSSVSHDLRAPLRTIHGFTNLLLANHGARLDEEGRSFLSRISDGAGRMDALVKDLLAFSRLGRSEMRRQECSPAAMVDTVLDELRTEREGREIELVVGQLPGCQADPSMLRQVFVNLLSNAFKYTRRRTAARVEIGSRRESGEQVYFVRDNGAGFDMIHADKLFGVFQRLHRPEQFEGTGIGLSLVRMIVEKHGGRIWAQAAPGEGATFSFTLAPLPTTDP